MSGPERRRDPRFAFARKVRLRYGSLEVFRDSYVRDISRGGVFLPGLLDVGRDENVTVVLQMADGVQFSVDGVVVRRVGRDEATEPGEIGCAVRFVDLDRARLDEMERYISGARRPKPESEFQQAPTRALRSFEAEATARAMSAREGGAGEAPAPAVDAMAALLGLADELALVERGHQANDVYAMLGVRASTPVDVIRGVAQGRLNALAGGTVPGRLPDAVRERVERACQWLQEALELVDDPARRAAHDVQMRHYHPPNRTPAEREALWSALARQREASDEKARREWPKAAALVGQARAAFAKKDFAAARTSVGLALLYDPYNPEINVLAADIEERLERPPS